MFSCLQHFNFFGENSYWKYKESFRMKNCSLEYITTNIIFLMRFAGSWWSLIDVGHHRNMLPDRKKTHIYYFTVVGRHHLQLRARPRTRMKHVCCSLIRWVLLTHTRRLMNIIFVTQQCRYREAMYMCNAGWSWVSIPPPMLMTWCISSSRQPYQPADHDEIYWTPTA